MSLKTLVYIRNVDNLSDARYCAGMGADLIGFKLDPQGMKGLSSKQYSEIINWLSGIRVVGEFGESSFEVIKEHIDQYKPDLLLIRDPEEVHNYSTLGIPLILSINMHGLNIDEIRSTMNFCTGTVEYFLLETSDGKADAVQYENDIITYSETYPLLLGFGVTKENVDDILEKWSLAGISLQGSEEIRPGYKDYDDLADILEEIEMD